MPLSAERFDRAMKRARVLRTLGETYEDAGAIALLLEERCKMHDYLGGVTMIYGELGMDLERWADLFRRVERYIGGKHLTRMREVLDRLDLCVT